MVDFPNRLRTLRLSKHITQKELATILGLQNSVISFYETGERMPSLEIIIKIAKYFHVTTDYLLGIETKDILDISYLSDKNKALVRQLIDSLHNP